MKDTRIFNGKKYALIDYAMTKVVASNMADKYRLPRYKYRSVRVVRQKSKVYGLAYFLYGCKK